MTTPTEKPAKHLAVMMEGGLVHAIVVDGRPPDLEIGVIDYDTEGSSPEHLVSVRQPSGHIAQAWAGVFRPEEATIDLEAVSRQLAEHGA